MWGIQMCGLCRYFARKPSVSSNQNKNQVAIGVRNETEPTSFIELPPASFPESPNSKAPVLGRLVPEDIPEPSLPLLSPEEEAWIGAFQNLRVFATSPIEPGILEWSAGMKQHANLNSVPPALHICKETRHGV